MQFHKLADIFPLMNIRELAALKADISSHGLRQPITTWQGKILDGRNRYNACQQLCIKPTFQEWQADGNPLEFVVSMNLHRRHLNESQRAMVGAKLANLPAHRPIRDKSANLRTSAVSQPEAAKLLNIGERTLQDAKMILDKHPEKVTGIEQGERSIHEVKREITKASIMAHAANSPKGKFRVIYADPPWQYSDTMGGARGECYGGAEKHYPTLSIAELCALPVEDWVEDNAVLFLWTTSPMLNVAFQVVQAWGFKYKASFVWDKVKHGMGHYNSVRHEFLLVCTRGSCTPDTPKLIDSVVSIPRTKIHSEKPEGFRHIIDTLYTVGRKLELFARKKSPGWETYGKEAH